MSISLPNGEISTKDLLSCLDITATPDKSVIPAIVIRNFDKSTEYYDDLEFYSLNEAVEYIKEHNTDRLRIMNQLGSIFYDFY